MDIKPIETVYNGYRFRSRLEARWAVFFDKMGIQYEYEPEGYVLDDGTKYLPDFYLCEIDAFVEIKPVGAISVKVDDEGVVFDDGRECGAKYAAAASTLADHHTFILLVGEPYDALARNHGGKGEADVFFTGVCLGKQYAKDDPEYKCCDDVKCADCNNPYHRCMYPVSGFTKKTVILCDTVDGMEFFPKNQAGFDLILLREGQEPYCTFEADENWLVRNVKAMRFARQARFEHGEKPAV